MDEKQIYTSSWLDELKRTLLKTKNEQAARIKGWFRESSKKAAKKTQSQKEPVAAQGRKAPEAQGLASKKEKPKTAARKKTGEGATRLEEKTVKAVAYTMFGLILLIIIVGIYLAYS